MYVCDYSYWRPQPTQADFELEVISRHPDFNERALKKYAVEGINTVGAYGDEKFEVHFHNKSYEDCQVRISLDGTDVLTGKPANLEVNHEMWVVRAGRTLHLKAWAENSNGGACFVFTSGDKGVSLNAHGDISHKGIISAAIFCDKDMPSRPRWAHYNARSIKALGGDMRWTNNQPINESYVASSLSADCNLYDMKKEAAVGAGEYVEQKTRTVKGLDNPVLYSIVRVKYVWWDFLKEMLNRSKSVDPFPTGFPGEKIKIFADLSMVPRVESSSVRTENLKTAQVINNNSPFDRLL